MGDAEQAVRSAAAEISEETSERLGSADTLSDEDRKTITENARQALVRFRPNPEESGADEP